MKEAFRLIYGKEWKWFLSLALAMKLRLIWFVVSFCLACALSFESSSVLSVIAVAINFCASSIALRGVPGDGLEE
jgi:hypothetical protein